MSDIVERLREHQATFCAAGPDCPTCRDLQDALRAQVAALTAERDKAARNVVALALNLADAEDRVAALTARGEARSMSDAPLDGTPVLVRIGDDLPEHAARFEGIFAVMRCRGDIMDWCFAAPMGQGGFPSKWLEGWWPLPAALRTPSPDTGDRDNG